MNLQSIFTLHNVVMGIAALIALFLIAKIMKTAVFAVYGCALALAVYNASASLLLDFIPQLSSIPYGQTFIPALLCIAISFCFCQMINGIRLAPLRIFVAIIIFLSFAAPTAMRAIFKF